MRVELLSGKSSTSSLAVMVSLQTEECSRLSQDTFVTVWEDLHWLSGSFLVRWDRYVIWLMCGLE